jgi:hypothetical protein
LFIFVFIFFWLFYFYFFLNFNGSLPATNSIPFLWMQNRYPHSFLESGSKPSAFLCCSAGRNPATRTVGLCFMNCLQCIYLSISLDIQTNTCNDVLHKPNYLKDEIYHYPDKWKNLLFVWPLGFMNKNQLSFNCIAHRTKFNIQFHFLDFEI